MWQYNNTDELQHWGIKGMKWGVRRYQNKDGSLTPAGRKRYDDDDFDREAYEKERVARAKSQILESDSAKVLYENRDLFTTQELQDAYRRLNTEKMIKDLIPKEVSKGEQFVNKVAKLGSGLGTMYTLVNNAQKLKGALTPKKDEDEEKGKDGSSSGKKKKKNKSGDDSGDVKSAVDSVKEAAGSAKEVFSKMDKNPVVDVAKGVISKYASMNTASVTPKKTYSSVSDYASYGKSSDSASRSLGGVLSKYASMDLSSIGTSQTSSGSSQVKSILDDFNYKFTDKKK